MSQRHPEGRGLLPVSWNSIHLRRQPGWGASRRLRTPSQPADEPVGIRQGFGLFDAEVGASPHRVLHRGRARHLQPVSGMRPSPQAQWTELAMPEMWLSGPPG